MSICKMCNKEYEKGHGRGFTKYCSAKCANAKIDQQKGIKRKRVCKMCSNPFEINKNGARYFYCSLACANKGAVLDRAKYWKKYRFVNRNRRFLFNRKCRMCGNSFEYQDSGKPELYCKPCQVKKKEIENNKRLCNNCWKELGYHKRKLCNECRIIADKEYRKKWYKSEKFKEIQKRWYQKNREKNIQKIRKYYRDYYNSHRKVKAQGAALGAI